MKVTIFGSGYVGLVSGACLAEAGNHVLCVDIDAAKVERLTRGEVPIHEPGLEVLIHRNADAGRLEFTTDTVRGVEHGLFLLTMHPHIIGHRSRIVVLERLIRYMKSRGSVWFGTHEQVAAWCKANS